jgi:hypothetical protein
MDNVTPVVVGDAVRVVDERYIEHDALVTCVHGTFQGPYTEEEVQQWKEMWGYDNPKAPAVGQDKWVPCINVVYVSEDETKRDPYGQQLERLSSLQHFSNCCSMPKPGRYWINK